MRTTARWRLHAAVRTAHVTHATIAAASIFLSSMSTLPPCPQCGSEYTYEDGVQLACPECGHEWSADAPTTGDDERVI